MPLTRGALPQAYFPSDAEKPAVSHYERILSDNGFVTNVPAEAEGAMERKAALGGSRGTPLPLFLFPFHIIRLSGVLLPE